MFDVNQYREKFRKKNIKPWYSGFGHMFGVALILIAAIVFLCLQLSSVLWWELLAIPLSFLVSNFVEYVAHRFPMHNKMKFMGFAYKKHTVDHHLFYTSDYMKFDGWKDFKVVLFPWWSALMFLGVIATPITLVTGLLVTYNFGILFGLTVLAYYIVYETFHFMCHASDTFAKTLGKHHTIHHDTSLMRKVNFNVVFPVFDLVFGTYMR